MKNYCTQNEGNCKTCSLVNYGRDCQNNKLDTSKYMHKETGSVDDREGWIASYHAEELEERGLTAEEAFEEDLDQTLIPIEKD